VWQVLPSVGDKLSRGVVLSRTTFHLVSHITIFYYYLTQGVTLMGWNSTGPPPSEYACHGLLQMMTDDRWRQTTDAKEKNNTGPPTLSVGGPVITPKHTTTKFSNQQTLNDISSNCNCFRNSLDDVLWQWKCWIIVIHINQVHYQLYAHETAAANQY